MKFTIAKTFEFSASHQLDHLPPDHQCARLHGHNYTVTVILEAEQLNDKDFVRDYGELADLKQYIDTALDHRHLNDVFGSGRMTTAENIAKTLLNLCLLLWPEVRAVRVSETPKTWAEASR